MQRIQFEITQNGYTHRDTLLVEDETPEQIEDMKQARFDAAYKILTTLVENPNPEVTTDESIE